jgi:hypothetical protein
MKSRWGGATRSVPVREHFDDAIVFNWHGAITASPSRRS